MVYSWLNDVTFLSLLLSLQIPLSPCLPPLKLGELIFWPLGGYQVSHVLYSALFCLKAFCKELNELNEVYFYTNIVLKLAYGHYMLYQTYRMPGYTSGNGLHSILFFSFWNNCYNLAVSAMLGHVVLIYNLECIARMCDWALWVIRKGFTKHQSNLHHSLKQNALSIWYGCSRKCFTLQTERKQLRFIIFILILEILF